MAPTKKKKQWTAPSLAALYFEGVRRRQLEETRVATAVQPRENRHPLDPKRSPVTSLDLFEELVREVGFEPALSVSFASLLRPPNLKHEDVQTPLQVFCGSIASYVPRVRDDKSFELFHQMNAFLNLPLCQRLYGLLIHHCYWTVIHPCVRLLLSVASELRPALLERLERRVKAHKDRRRRELLKIMGHTVTETAPPVEIPATQRSRQSEGGSDGGTLGTHRRSPSEAADVQGVNMEDNESLSSPASSESSNRSFVPFSGPSGEGTNTGVNTNTRSVSVIAALERRNSRDSQTSTAFSVGDENAHMSVLHMAQIDSAGHRKSLFVRQKSIPRDIGMGIEHLGENSIAGGSTESTGGDASPTKSVTTSTRKRAP